MAKEAYNDYGFHPYLPGMKPFQFPVAASQTLVKGDPVIISSGQVAVAVQASSAELLGFMAQDSSSATAGTMVEVFPALPHYLFVGRASADASSVAIDTYMDLSGTTGAFVINVAASTQDLFCLWGTVPGQTNSETGALLIVSCAKFTLGDLTS